MTLALQRAEETKLADAKELVAGALDCLERMRGEDGVFAYMLGAEGARARTRRPRRPATRAAGRPASWRCCTASAAIRRGSRSALELFREHAASLLRERGKVLMHCGPEGQGCHYILFDLWTAALAVRELPEKERAPYRALLVESLMQLRSKEGGFRDTPILGWDCGTALALLALDGARAAALTRAPSGPPAGRPEKVHAGSTRARDPGVAWMATAREPIARAATRTAPW